MNPSRPTRYVAIGAVAGLLALAGTAVAAGAPATSAGLPPCAPSAKASCLRADLHGMNLRGRDLRGIDLRAAILHHVDFRKADLRGARLRGANLHHADLRGARLDRADLRRANLSHTRGGALGARRASNGVGCPYTTPYDYDYGMAGANLAGANLSQASYALINFSGANLSGANLTQATFTGTDFTNANLGGATVTGAFFGCSFMPGANLVGLQGQPADFPQRFPTGWGQVAGTFVGPGAQLVNGSFSGADFTHVSLRGANLSAANVSSASFTGVDLSGANFADIDAQFAEFSGANLSGAGFTNSDFTNANMTNASFRGAVFYNTSWFQGATVSGSDFTGASNPSGVQTQPTDPNYYGFVDSGIYGVGTVSNGVTCAPGVVTNDFATCFPPSQSFPFPPCSPGEMAEADQLWCNPVPGKRNRPKGPVIIWNPTPRQ